MRPEDVTKFYHIWLTPQKPDPSNSSRVRKEVEMDLSIEELERRFLVPYRLAKPIVIKGRTIAIDEIVRIEIYQTGREIRNLASIPWRQMLEVTDTMVTGPAGSDLEATPSKMQKLRPAASARDVFVVHGRNDKARDALFAFLRSIKLDPLEWAEAVRFTGKPMPYVGEVLDAAFTRAHAVVVLFTPDDEARLKKEFRTDNDPPHEIEPTGQARPNVLFEAGMAMSRNQDRTVLVELGKLRPFSDLAGRHVIRLDDSSQRRQELAQRLVAARCPVNLDGTDWHSAGDFEAALAQVVEDSSDSTVIVEEASVISEVPCVSNEAKELLIEAARDRDRSIIMTRSGAGLRVMTNGRNFVEMGNGRSEARWQQAIRDLVDHGLVVDRNGKDNVFEVTHKGYETADAILASY